jgi:5-oxoprolinase (ATP-hydrolysing)
MPPFSTRIEEEGVQINNFKLVDRGVLREQEMLALLRSGKHPSRNPEQNMADLKAQIAANEKGVQELRKMVDQFGLDVVQAYMRHVQDNAEESVRRVITRLKDGEFTLPLDNGAQIQVAIRVDAKGRSAEIDFTGTSPQQENNFNAPTAVCMAAVLYVFRTLVNDDIPLNAGCLKPLKVIIPRRLHAQPEPAGLGGGGQRGDLDLHHQRAVRRAGRDGGGPVHDEQLHLRQRAPPVLRDHLGRLGRGRLYDEQGKLCGGFDGTSVVQTHMTNSRLTDPEVLEFRFPVRLESYEIREGSGGAGRWHGGNGGVRRVRFLEPMTASILSNGRKQVAPSAWPAAAGAGGHQPRGAGRRPRRGAGAHRLGGDAAGRRVRDPHAGRRRLRLIAALARS